MNPSYFPIIGWTLSNSPVSNFDYLGMADSVRGTFLLEAKAGIYWDLAKIHFSVKNIYVEDLREDNNLIWLSIKPK